ncbi:MAG: ribosome silencing factor [Anaerolineaceae bacterium]|nr:ribosome silencing factor [Anaerolineaceae bacterium]
MAKELVEALEEKKAENIILMDIQEIASFTDYFIICSGTSDRMLSSLVDTITETAKKKGELLSKSEGEASGGWILVDLGDIILHVFSPDQREYYQLERLWDKGKVLLHVQ